MLQLRSVEYARNHGVRIHCRSSFTEEPGTFVVGEEETMERPLITAVTHSRDEARVTLLGVPDHPGVAGRIFTALADANVNVDMIIQNEPVSEGARPTCRSRSRARTCATARAALDPLVAELGIRAVAEDPEMGKVSIVGAGMKSHPGVAAKVFSTLGDEDINIEMISTSPIKISCVVSRRRGRPRRARAARAFELGADQVEAEHPFGAQGMRVRAYRVAVVGATGAVGTVMRAKLRERGFPASEIVPFASERSAGRELDGAIVQPLTDETIQGFDLAIFSAGASTSGEWAPRFVEAGAVVVDNSLEVAARPRGPARRLRGQPGGARRPQGPDRQPELLDDAADGRAQADPRRGRHRAPDRLDLPVRVRHRRRRRSTSSTSRPTPCCTARSRRAPQVYPHPIAFNVLGGAGNFADGDDHTDEERKMMFETRKILGDESIAINVTCARVPVRNCHSESVTLQTREPLSVEDARALLAAAPG